LGNEMTQSLLWVLGILAGILIPIQTALNAQLGRIAGHPIVTTLLVFLVGVLACIFALLVMQPATPQLAQFGQVPLWAWGGGMIAMVYVVLLVTLAPKLGVGLTTALVLVGQLLAALALDHFGVLGNPQHSLNIMRLLGLALMIAGVVLIKNY
jgi:bacterial/archaeal transporter family-2 protein